MAGWQELTLPKDDKSPTVSEDWQAEFTLASESGVHAGAEENGNWLFSFSDMVTLLLSFFILLSSVSTPDEEKLKKIQASLAKTLKVSKSTRQMLTELDRKRVPHVDLSTGGNKVAVKTDGESGVDPQQAQESVPLAHKVTQIESILSVLETVIQAQGLTESVTIARYQNAATVSFPEGIFFPTGDARFNASARPFLDKTASALLSIREDFIVEVEGHTDDRPVLSSAKRYPTNWELSTARATAVVRYLIGRGVAPKLLVAKGFADTRPVAPNLDSLGNPIADNRNKNRRVVLKIVAAAQEGEGP